MAGFVDWLLGRKDAQDVGGQWFDRFFAGPETHSGQHVNWRTALEVSTVLACVRVLAEGIAQMPWRVMRQRPGGVGADKATDHPLYDIINRRPNSWQTSFEYRETIMMHLALTNNHYSLKSKARGNVIELLPLEPGRVAVTRNDDLSLSYQITLPDGSGLTVPQSEIWHIRGPSWNSWQGLETLCLAREAIGLSMSLEKTGAAFQKNALKPSGLLSVDGNLTPEQHKLLLAHILKTRMANSGDPLLSDRGAKWTPFGMNGVDMQHIESRKFQIEEVCRVFRVMPLMVGASDKTATYASAEQMFLAHVIHTLMPWAERIEQSGDVNLLGAKNDTGLYLHLDAKGLMRGAAQARSEYFAKALGAGGSPPWMTQDEVRDEDDLNPMGGAAAILREPSNVGTVPAANSAP